MEKNKMNVRKLTAVLLAALLCAGAMISLSSCGKSAEYTVGICQAAPHDALDAATRGFKEQLVKELGEGKVKFLENNAQGDKTVCTTIINDFVSKKVDLIMANATDALQAAANGTNKIPVLGTSITEYGTALGLKDFNGTVGRNVSGTSDLAPLADQAKMITEIFPDAKTVGLLYCSAEPNSDYQVKVVKEELEKMGLTCTNYAFADSNEINTIAAKAAEEDVIYIPTDNTAATCTGTILGAIGDTPVVAGEKSICSGCGVVTLSIDYYDLGVATAKMAAKILKGDAKIEEMPIEYAAEVTKMYNADRCKALGIDTADLEAKGYVPIPTEG